MVQFAFIIILVHNNILVYLLSLFLFRSSDHFDAISRSLITQTVEMNLYSCYYFHSFPDQLKESLCAELSICSRVAVAGALVLLK